MGAFDQSPQTARELEDEKPCWQEMLEAAFGGLYPSDQQLEAMLDHLERTP